MTRRLRQRHRATVCLLGVLLPAAFTAGLAARRPIPIVAAVSPALAVNPPDFGKIVWTDADLWPGQSILTRLRRNAAGSVAVELMFRELERPDVLAYWSPGNDGALENLTEHARLLGVLSNRSPLPIPAEVHGQVGRFVLYSLADHEVVAVSKAFNVQKD
jgi:hypothetical protein